MKKAEAEKSINLAVGMQMTDAFDDEISSFRGRRTEKAIRT